MFLMNIYYLILGQLWLMDGAGRLSSKDRMAALGKLGAWFPLI